MEQLIVLSDCENRFLVNHLKKQFEDTSLEVLGGGYNQIEQYIYDSQKPICEYMVLLFSPQVMYERYMSLGRAERAYLADDYLQRIKTIWDRLAQLHVKCIVQLSMAELPENVWGNYAVQEKTSFTFQVRRFNQLLAEESQGKDSLRILDLQQIQLSMGNKDFFDTRMYYLARFPFSMKAVCAIGKNMQAIISSFSGKQKKAVVCDLDGLLWGGAIGENGLDGILLGEYGEGAIFKDIQRWLKCLKDRGILLAYCSKNAPENAALPFQQHPDMVLQLQDFVERRAGWNNKSEELLHIGKVLNLRTDSFVFLDDSPLERAEIKARLPEVTVPEMPEDPLEYLAYLRQLCLFESGPITETDLRRSEQYCQETSRNSARELYTDYNSFLKALKLQMVLSEWSEGWFDRISQLNRRTNQFNLNNTRLSSDDVRRISVEGPDTSMCASLEDCYGTYGLCGGAAWEYADKVLQVNSFFLSCRVFKRGVEEFLLDQLLRTAEKHGCEKVSFQYENTGKNQYLMDFLQNNGAYFNSAGKPEILLAKYQYHETFITLRNVQNGK